MKRTLGIMVIIIILVAIIVTFRNARPIADHPFYDRFQDKPLVMAHQGGDGLWPGDTLYAFTRASDMGVDVLEMDLHVTADDVLVLMHDETVDRTTNGTGAIEDMSLAVLKELDAGYDWTADDGKTFPFRGQGIQVPTLEEVFQTFPGTAMNIEIKKTNKDMAPQLCEMIRRYNKENEVLIASFRSEAIESFRQTCPEIATSGSESDLVPLVLLSKVGLAWLYRPTAQAVQVPQERSGIQILVPGFVRAAHGRNMKVDAWTINDTTDMQRMIDLGVDGIITDYPDRLLPLLGRQ